MRGEFGDVFEVSPWLAALPYALDRFELKGSINESLASGVMVVSNRYVGSNLGHISAKLPAPQRETLFGGRKNLNIRDFVYQRKM